MGTFVLDKSGENALTAQSILHNKLIITQDRRELSIFLFVPVSTDEGVVFRGFVTVGLLPVFLEKWNRK